MCRSELARITFWYPGEDGYGCHTASGVKLITGEHAAVDPSIIPYGSRIQIPGIGTRIAVDTGSCVVNRKAAKRAGKTSLERSAIVIDLAVNKRDYNHFEQLPAIFAVVTWTQ